MTVVARSTYKVFDLESQQREDAEDLKQSTRDNIHVYRLQYQKLAAA